MIIERDDLLNEWIQGRVKTLYVVCGFSDVTGFFRCDAEAEPFAKYVQALLRKDVSTQKLREICADQLNVFLGDSEFNYYGLKY